MSALFRIFRFAFQNFFRNFWLSVATLTVLIITLILFNIIVSINEIKSATIAGVEERVNISIDFKQTVPETEVRKIQQTFQADESVERIILVSPDENLERFTARYPEIGEKIIPILDANPLGYTLILQARELEDYATLLEQIEGNEELTPLLESQRFNDFRSLTAQAAVVSERINTGAFSLAGIFLVITIIIVFNTIRVSVYTHREEIGIMRLVGATNWFIRSPFLMEAIMYALVATALAGGIVMILVQVSQPVIDRFFTGFTEINLIAFYSINWLNMFGTQFIAISFVTLASTSIALSRYL